MEPPHQLSCKKWTTERHTFFTTQPLSLQCIWTHVFSVFCQSQKQIAEAHLTMLWRRLLTLRMDSAGLKEVESQQGNLSGNEKSETNNLDAKTDVESDESIIDRLLKQDSTDRTIAVTNMPEASLAIESFDNTPRVDRNENLF